MKHLLVVSDDTLTDVTEGCVEIQARVQLKDHEKTVAAGPWYEEHLPAEDGRLEQTMFGWGNNFAVSEDETHEFLAGQRRVGSLRVCDVETAYDEKRR